MMPRARAFGAALAVIAIGLVWRLAPLGLNAFWLKWGGSVLWGTMVYLLVAACRPARLGRAGVIAVALVIAAAVELSRLYHTPALDAFRLTLPGALLLGRVFSGWNIVAYALGILLGWALGRGLQPRRHEAPQHL
jgi:hypothetical protein